MKSAGMKNIVLKNGLCLIAVLCAFGCSSDTSTIRIVTVVEPQAPRTEVAHKYVYDQKAETNKKLFNDAKAHKFVSEFGAIFAGQGKPAPTFAIRVNPTADGGRTQPGQFADQQAIADCVRYFGRPLREGGIKLLDESASSNAKVDIVLNVLISWRTIPMTGFHGEAKTKTVPDVQVTAIRTADGAVLGQAGTTRSYWFARRLMGHRGEGRLS